MIDRYRPDMLPKLRSPLIRAAAAGKPCTLRIASFYPGGACAGTNTTVACHLPVVGKGVGTKVTDLAVAFGCSVCHDIIDGRAPEKAAFIRDKYPAALVERLLGALVETQAILVDEDILTVNDPRLQTIRPGNWR